jgi:ribosomal subunit interface protein
MKKPPIHITAHDLDLSSALRDFIHLKISGLSRFAGDILAAEVVLRGKSGAAHLFSVSARLALPGKDIQGNAVHANLYTAIDQLVARLARLSRKRKTRKTNVFRRSGKKLIKSSPAASIFSCLEMRHSEN